MSTRTGTHDLASLLANRFQTVVDFGVDRVAETFAAELEVHNRIMNEAVADLADVTTDKQRLSGSSDNMGMTEADEYTRPPTQRPQAGLTVGFPLRSFQIGLGWTRKWLETRTVRDAALMFDGAQKAHRKQVLAELKKAITGSANYTFRDHLMVPMVDLAVKRFYNADGAEIPEGPNGEAYNGATHTHYLGSASLTAAAAQNLVNTVVEHGLNGGQLRLVISATDRAAFEALTGFKAYPDPRVNYVATDQNRTPIQLGRLDNLAIGTFSHAEVWVKPWGIANYVIAHVVGGSAKPLAIRTRTGSFALQMVAEIEAYPLQAQYMESEFGVGVWERGMGGVLYFANATYADPTITV